MVWSRVSLDLEPGANPSGGENEWGIEGGEGEWGGPELGVTPPESHNSSCSGTNGGCLDRSEVGSREGGIDGQGDSVTSFFPPRDEIMCACMWERESYHHPPSLASCLRHQVWILSLIQHVFISEWQLGWGVSSSQASDQSWQILCFSFSPSLLSLLSPFLWLLSVFLLGLPTRWQHQSLSEVGLEAKGDFWGRLVWEHSRLVLLDSISTHIINVMGVVFHACRQWHDVMKSKVTEKKNTKSKHFNDKWKNGFESL